MKGQLLISVFLLSGMGLFAQFGPPSLVSPEINGTNVTVRFRAPKAIKVELNGSFLPVKEVETSFGNMLVPAPVEMTQGEDGVWEYTAENVAPDFYTYTITVDEISMLDPNNLQMVRDGQNVTNYLIVPGEKSKFYLGLTLKKP